MSFLTKTVQLILGKDLNFQVGFIICGTQKGGTTALDYYLRLHPEICMANKKEVHFFDNDRNFLNQDPNYFAYHIHFNPKSIHEIIGEATPIYMYWNHVMERIRHYNPNIKLIVILRNPIHRAFSHWNMERDRKRENRTFWKAIQEEGIKNKTRNQDRTFSYIDRGFYSRQIIEIYKYFEKEQLLILKNEDLRNNPNIVLDKVAEFLSITAFEDIRHEEIHSRKYLSKINHREYEFLSLLYRNEIQDLENLLNWDLSSWSK